MDGCIIWTGAVQSSGYGSVTNGKGSSVLVHRREWEHTNGPIAPGMTIDHLCRERLCINVEHMEVVSRAENSRRKNEAQTHCVRGHDLINGDVRLQTRKNGLTYRVCRDCVRVRQAGALK